MSFINYINSINFANHCSFNSFISFVMSFCGLLGRYHGWSLKRNRGGWLLIHGTL